MGKQKSARIDKILQTEVTTIFAKIYGELDRKNLENGKPALREAYKTAKESGMSIREAECHAIRTILPRVPSIFSLQTLINGKKPAKRIAQVAGIDAYDFDSDSMLLDAICDKIMATKR